MKKKGKFNPNHKNNWPIETNPEMRMVMELADRTFKIIIKNMIKDREKHEHKEKITYFLNGNFITEKVSI